MIVKYKLVHPEAKLPYQATSGSTCLDLTAVSIKFNGTYFEYDTGVAFEIPDGWEARVYARSSVSDRGLILSNGVGKIDSDYRGTVKARFYYLAKDAKPYLIGDRICQIEFLPKPEVTLVQSDTLSPTSRGEGGYGSTGV